MQFLFIPTFISLLDKLNRNVEICEKSLENGSGECMHTYKFHRSKLLSTTYSDNDLKEIERDMNNSQISIREVPGGVHLITSLRFFNTKLLNYYQNNENNNQLMELYFKFFVKALLYLVNYYYYIKKEPDIHIEKSAFQSLLGFQSMSGKFTLEFERMKEFLIDIGLFDFLFIYSRNGLDHYVFSETAFLSISKTVKFLKLKV